MPRLSDTMEEGTIARWLKKAGDPIKKGDVLGAPSGGPETAHQIINTGSTPLIYLGLSTKAKTEICEYPDSGKFLAKTNREGSSFDHIGRGENALDYWDGEPGL